MQSFLVRIKETIRWSSPYKAMCLIMIMLFAGPLSLSAEGWRVLFIGDSVTDGGWGRSGGSMQPSSERNHHDKNHIYGHSYMFLCAAYYQSKYPERDYAFFNRGISGYTLSDLEKHWDEDVIALQPDVLSVLIGINDVDAYLKQKTEASFDFQDWENRYRALLDKAVQQNDSLKIVLASPFVADVGRVHSNGRYHLMDSLIIQCALVVGRIAKDYHAVYLPYHEMFQALPSTAQGIDNTYWIWDGIHPTPAGHKRMADCWIEQTESVFFSR